jgi:hypothetical protein
VQQHPQSFRDWLGTMTQINARDHAMSWDYTEDGPGGR